MSLAEKLSRYRPVIPYLFQSQVIELEMIASVTVLAGTRQGSKFDKFGKIACRGRGRCVRDGLIVVSAQPAFETVAAFREQAQKGFFLPCIDLSLKSIEEMGLRNQEADLRKRTILRLQNDFAKPTQPFVDFQTVAAPVKLRIIVLTVSMDGLCQRSQRWPIQSLRKRFLSDCPPDPPITVFERVDALEP